MSCVPGCGRARPRRRARGGAHAPRPRSRAAGRGSSACRSGTSRSRAGHTGARRRRRRRRRAAAAAAAAFAGGLALLRERLEREEVGALGEADRRVGEQHAAGSTSRLPSRLTQRPACASLALAPAPRSPGGGSPRRCRSRRSRSRRRGAPRATGRGSPSRCSFSMRIASARTRAARRRAAAAVVVGDRAARAAHTCSHAPGGWLVALRREDRDELAAAGARAIAPVSRFPSRTASPSAAPPRGLRPAHEVGRRRLAPRVPAAAAAVARGVPAAAAVVERGYVPERCRRRARRCSSEADPRQRVAEVEAHARPPQVVAAARGAAREQRGGAEASSMAPTTNLKPPKPLLLA